MAGRVWGMRIVLLLVLRRLVFVESIEESLLVVCPKVSPVDSILVARDSNCPVSGGIWPTDGVGVVEGDEDSLVRAQSMVNKNGHDYVAILFYASWCPFSRTCRPRFSIVAALYSSIPHFAIEESAIRPSILSKYGVRGFPTLFLVNSTMWVRYHGSRTLHSLVAFYDNITGTKSPPLGRASWKAEHPSPHERRDGAEPESCPFSWAKYPEHLLQKEAYLALATAFVLLRLIVFISPTLRFWSLRAWRSYARNVGFGRLCSWEFPSAHLNGAVQLLRTVRDPCMKSNLQEGAMSARAWASKSLASVSIGDASTSRAESATECY